MQFIQFKSEGDETMYSVLFGEDVGYVVIVVHIQVWYHSVKGYQCLLSNIMFPDGRQWCMNLAIFIFPVADTLLYWFEWSLQSIS